MEFELNSSPIGPVSGDAPPDYMQQIVEGAITRLHDARLDQITIAFNKAGHPVSDRHQTKRLLAEKCEAVFCPPINQAAIYMGKDLICWWDETHGSEFDPAAGLFTVTVGGMK